MLHHVHVMSCDVLYVKPSYILYVMFCSDAPALEKARVGAAADELDLRLHLDEEVLEGAHADKGAHL